VLIALVVLNHQLGEGGLLVVLGQAALAVLVAVLSALMVSRVRFRSFKDLKLSRRTVTLVAGGLGAGIVAVYLESVRSGVVFVTLMAVYVALGLMEEMIFFRRRRHEAAAARAPLQIALEAEGGARSDEEVLEELGAFDEERDEPAVAPRHGLEPAPLRRT
jgi:CDP-diacylglycerol--serine O-phosphatidyltransferase